MPGLRARLRHMVSGQVLFYGALALSALLTAAFCMSVLTAARRADQRMVQTLETQMLRILEENGISGLAAAFDASRSIVPPGTDRLELALWQIRGDTRRALIETAPGAATAFAGAPPGAKLGGVDFGLQRVDVAAASQGWALPMQDVALVFGYAQPSNEMRRAMRMIAAIVAVSLCVCAVMLFLQALHWQRYRRSLQRINSLLDRYSNGETGIRFGDEAPAPELHQLGQHLNVVLPKIDGLFADLRALSAHLAHELRTPLQTIRGGTRKIVREPDEAQRIELARRMDQIIDSADARVQTVMQLFRLQADADVAMTPGVALGAVLEDLVYDFEEDLQGSGRRLDIAIDTSAHVLGNRHLLELMISNLLSNAVKYAPGNSRIDVALATRNDRFRLSVSNAGALPDGLGDNAFDRYAQGSEHRSITGFGLGLALVHAVAQKHGFTARLHQEATSDGAPRVVAVIAGDLEAADAAQLG